MTRRLGGKPGLQAWILFRGQRRPSQQRAMVCFRWLLLSLVLLFRGESRGSGGKVVGPFRKLVSAESV